MLDGTTRRYGLLTTAVLVRDGRCDPLAWLRPVQSLQPPGRHLWRPDAGLPVYATRSDASGSQEVRLQEVRLRRTGPMNRTVARLS